MSDLHEEVAELGSPRTVYRDLEALEEAGFPLYQEDDGRWRVLTPTEGGTSVPIQPTELVEMVRGMHERGLAAHGGLSSGDTSSDDNGL